MSRQDRLRSTDINEPCAMCEGNLSAPFLVADVGIATVDEKGLRAAAGEMQMYAGRFGNAHGPALFGIMGSNPPIAHVQAHRRRFVCWSCASHTSLLAYSTMASSAELPEEEDA